MCLVMEEKEDETVEDPELCIQDIHDIKRMVIEEMDEYIRDGECCIMQVWGFFRHHIPMESEIIAFCGSEEMRTGTDVEQNIAASRHLHRFLTAKLNIVQPRLMKAALTDLTKEIESSLEFDHALPFVPYT